MVEIGECCQHYNICKGFSTKLVFLPWFRKNPMTVLLFCHNFKKCKEYNGENDVVTGLSTTWVTWLIISTVIFNNANYCKGLV